jgi:hypothetical protein
MAMIEFTESQLQAMEGLETGPIQIVNPRTDQTYILVPQSTYERLKSLLDISDCDPDEGDAYINEVMAEDDENDPLLESYQKYARPS